MTLPGFERVHVRHGRYYLLVPSTERAADGKKKGIYIDDSRF